MSDYRPGLPSAEAVREHEERGGWWQAWYGDKDPPDMYRLSTANYEDWADESHNKWPRLCLWRPAMLNGTPCPWPGDPPPPDLDAALTAAREPMADLNCAECIEAARTLSRLNHDSGACKEWDRFWREHRGERLRHLVCDMADAVVAALARAETAERDLAAAREEIERLTKAAAESHRLNAKQWTDAAACHLGRARALAEAEGALKAVADGKSPACLWAETETGPCAPDGIVACPACRAGWAVADLRADRARLQEAIKGAPHADTCLLALRGEYPDRRCDCWKASALAAEDAK